MDISSTFKDISHFFTIFSDLPADLRDNFSAMTIKENDDFKFYQIGN